MSVDIDYLEKCIIYGLLFDKKYSSLVLQTFQTEFFSNPEAKESFWAAKEYAEEYKKLPDFALFKNLVKTEKSRSYIDSIETFDFNMATSFDWLLTNTNNYLKEQAIKCAVIDTFNIIEKEGVENYAKIKKIIDDALIKDLKIDLGLNYFQQLGERLKRIADADNKRIPTYFPIFDEFINGGFPPYTLSVMLGRVHGCKSATMCNFAQRQVLHGHNVCLFTLEMSEDAFAQRFDSGFSLMDINEMYRDKRKIMELASRLKKIKETNNIGNLYIKQFPPGSASVLDFRIYLRELQMRDELPEIIYADYINLMKSAYNKAKGDNLYIEVKKISEELRALSFEFEIPVVSVSQLNREGMTIDFSSVDMTHISESVGLPATVDFLSVLGRNEDDAVYQSEVWYKILKNRLGGRVGQMDNYYIDQRSLKMYDSSELDLFLEEASITGDTREFVQR